MGRKQADSQFGRFTLLLLFLIAAVSCCMAYLSFSAAFKGSGDAISLGSRTRLKNDAKEKEDEEEENECCRGIEHLELWGDAVKWGSITDPLYICISTMHSLNLNESPISPCKKNPTIENLYKKSTHIIMEWNRDPISSSRPA